ncbi:hypothetical protein GCM10027612_64030 [Microbispora bryophytorum subsp. camponoti]
MALQIVSVVAGEELPSGTPYESVNPARPAQTVATVLLAGADDFAGACRAASAAQREWARVPAPVRGRVIASIGRLVEANTEALARLVTEEIGKPYAEALGEVREIVDTCDFFLGEGRRLYGQTVPSEMPDKSLFTFRVPVGVAAVVTAGNFPVAVPSWYLVPALLCGNAVVWKPAEYAAASAHALYRLFAAAGLPDGVLNLVFADGDQTYAGLDRALGEGTVQKVGFTGSSAVGRAVGELCGRHLQSPCLELGGKNPMVVMPDADLDLAAEGALFSGFGTAGQRCTSSARSSSTRTSTTSSCAGSPRRCVTRRSATRTATCCTARCSTTSSPSDTRSIWAGSSRTTPCCRARSAGWTATASTTTLWWWTASAPATGCSLRRRSARSWA